MSVTRPSNSKYYHIVVTRNGKTKRGSSKTTNKKLAQEIERQWIDELIRQTELGQGEDISLDDAIDLLLKKMAGKSTAKVYTSALKRVTSFIDGKKNLSELNEPLLHRFTQHFQRTLSDNTVRNSLIALRSTIDNARSLGYLTPQLKFPTVAPKKNRLRFLNDDEIDRLLKELHPSGNIQRQDAYDLVVLLLHLGARHLEVANMEWRQIDFERERINLYRPKVRNESFLLMDSTVKQVLTRRWANRRSDKWIFTDRTGTKPRDNRPYAIKRAMERAGIEDATIHDIRHTTASKLAQAGFSLQEIGQVLGHAAVTSSAKYAHLVHSDVMQKVVRLFEKKDDENVVQIRQATK